MTEGDWEVPKFEYVGPPPFTLEEELEGLLNPSACLILKPTDGAPVYREPGYEQMHNPDFWKPLEDACNVEVEGTTADDVWIDAISQSAETEKKEKEKTQEK